MAAALTDNFAFQGNYAPILGEIDAPVLRVTAGELPRDFAGTLYRNGPNPMFPPIGDHHWFLGEGMIHAVTVEDGRVSYRNRWVRTPQYEAQRRAGKRLFSSGFGGASFPAAEGVTSNPSNTNILWHGGRLMSLAEGPGHLPMAIDPDSLDTLGPVEFEGGYEGPFSAHPKIDPQSGELLTFGNQATGLGSPDISYTVIGPDGGVRRREIFAAPFTSLVHDFLTTSEHVIFPICPATIDGARMMKGGPLIAWEPDKGTHIGVMSRAEGVSSMQWFQTDACHVYHPMNAYTSHEGGRTRIIADVMRYDRAPVLPDLDGSPQTQYGPARLVRWTLDLSDNSSTVKEQPISDLPGEFPRLDERFTGLAYRHGYYAGVSNQIEQGAGFDVLAHVDFQTGSERVWLADPGQSVMEPVFVPRSAGAGEGDGWITTLIYDKARNLSDFAVFDAKEISAGPVARVELPTRVPLGFHGNWRPAA